MSFSLETKYELTNQKFKNDRAKLLVLTGITLTAGNISIGTGKIALRYVTESYPTAKLIIKLATKLYSVSGSISVSDKLGINSRSTIVTIEGEDVSRLISDTGLMDIGNEREYDYPDDAQKKMLLTGAFLGAGSITDPKKSYHMEIVCRTERFAEVLCKIFTDFDITAKYFERKESYVLYIKDAENIFSFLALIGASKAAVELTEVRVIKDVKNNINRKNNCESANMQKTAQAAARQAMAIEIIRDTVGLETLPAPLRAAAEVRINNMEATLSELADMLGIGKSGMSHRLNRIVEIAQELIV
ncbi:MAG: DNA-binding protein WhiA [Clostridia bacterium]|nr:DNA-binding protein WhiA [Clostridia bacterium]